jgi:S-DNA-T family DNA segregation ATPase FtsK/SpoIIIE
MLVLLKFTSKNMAQLTFFEKLNQHKSKYEGHTLPVCIGVNSRNNPIILDLVKLPHLRITGLNHRSNSIIKVLLSPLFLGLSSDRFKMVWIDQNESEFKNHPQIRNHYLAGLKKQKGKAIKSKTSIHDTLYALRYEMERRVELLKGLECRNIKEYNVKCTGKNKIPYLILILNDMEYILEKTNHEINVLASLIAVARATGIHVIRIYNAQSTEELLDISPLVSIDFDPEIIIKKTFIAQANMLKRLLAKNEFILSHKNQYKRLKLPLIEESGFNSFVNYDMEGNISSGFYVLKKPPMGYIRKKNKHEDKMFEEAARKIVLDQKKFLQNLDQQVNQNYSK